MAVADKYYAFTREGSGERLLIVFHSGDAAENITLDVTDTSIADAKGFAPIFGGTPVRLQATRVSYNSRRTAWQSTRCNNQSH